MIVLKGSYIDNSITSEGTSFDQLSYYTSATSALDHLGKMKNKIYGNYGGLSSLIYGTDQYESKEKKSLSIKDFKRKQDEIS